MMQADAAPMPVQSGWWDTLETTCAVMPLNSGCQVFNGGKGVVEQGEETMKDAAVSGFEGAVTWAVNQMAASTTQMMQVIATFWTDPAWTPTIATQSVCDNTNCPPDQWSQWRAHPVITALGVDLSWVVMLFLVLGVIAGVVRMIWDMRAMELVHIARSVFLTMLSATAIVAAVQICLVAGDAFSKEILDRTAQRADEGAESGSALSQSFMALVTSPGIQFTGSVMFVMLILFLLLLIASFMQIGFMLVRAAMLFLMLVVLPVVAAGSATPDGMARFRKMIAYLVAFVLYKPVAAIIYSVGFSLLSMRPVEEGDMASVTQTLYGFTVIAAAALALPALIKFCAPIASIGSSNASSGAVGLAAGAAVGAGVAVVAAGAATGGAGLAGAGAAGGGGAGSAGASAPTGSGTSAGLVGRHTTGGGSSTSGQDAPPASGSSSMSRELGWRAGSSAASGATSKTTTVDDLNEGETR